MEHLESVILNMTDGQKSEFRTFLLNKRKAGRRKDLELFDIISSPDQEENPGLLIYKQMNSNAYHAARKRLSRKISDYLVLSRLEDDVTLGSTVMGMISLARYYREQGAYKLAQYYIKKAELKARESEQFDLVHIIYLFLIENADVLPNIDLEEVIDKMEANKILWEEDESMTVASGLIRSELQKIKIEGKDIDFEHVIQEVLKRYGLMDTIIRRPKLLYNILSIVRSSILTNKDFSSFEPYIIYHYERSEREFGYGKKDHFYKLSILYMIAHVLYRNRKFNESGQYLELLFSEMSKFKRSYFKLFYSRYILLKAAVKCYSGQLLESISILESAIKSHKSWFSTEERVNLLINLSIYYFENGESGRAIRTTNSIGHTDSWYEKKMGKEWVFKKNLMEIMAQVESGNEEIALSRIRWFEKTYKNLFGKPIYERAKTFVTLIKTMITNPVKFASDRTKDLVARKLITVPEEEEDLQAMAFYAWIKSKILKSNFYEELLLTTRTN